MFGPKFRLSFLVAATVIGSAAPSFAQQSTPGQQSAPEAAPSVPADACERWKSSGVVLQRPFQKQGAYGYVATAPSLAAVSDDLENPRRSTALLCENGKPIGTPHTIHDDIRQKGGGQFSHWRGEVVFSAPDNSDPNTNGREYVLVRPPG